MRKEVNERAAPPLPELAPDKPLADRGTAYSMVRLAVILSLGIIVLVAFWAFHAGGSVRGALAYLRGDSIYVPPTVDVPGDGSSGSSVRLVNLTATTFQIVAFSPSCPCVRLLGLPVTLGPRETKEVAVRAGSVLSKRVAVVLSMNPPTRNTVQFEVDIVAVRL